ncbi:holo-ACP synthase [Verrucomicrobia bacterium]|nr:holo-ACP synthase [Verrucomicrobiota bacterium]
MAIKGLGIDVVKISRISAQIRRNHDRLAKYILTEIELGEFYESIFPDRFLAKRFAVKEAAAKALGVGISQGVKFGDFHTNNDSLGRPILTVSGKSKEIALKKDIISYHLSISDEKNYVVATVIYES